MKRIFPVLAVGMVFVAGSLMPANAGPQVGGGAILLDDNHNDFLGFALELGFYEEGSIYHQFIGATFMYASDESTLEGGIIDTGYLALLAIYRGHLSMGHHSPVSIYGEAGIGLSRVDVTFSEVRDESFELDNYSLGYTFGIGVEYKFNQHVAIRGGYNLLGFAEVSGFSQEEYGGNLGAFNASLALRF